MPQLSGLIKLLGSEAFSDMSKIETKLPWIHRYILQTHSTKPLYGC